MSTSGLWLLSSFPTKAAAANLLANHHLQRNALLLLPRKLLLASPARAKVQALKNLLNRFVLASKTIKKVPVFKELFLCPESGFPQRKNPPHNFGLTFVAKLCPALVCQDKTTFFRTAFDIVFCMSKTSGKMQIIILRIKHVTGYGKIKFPPGARIRKNESKTFCNSPK